jgi:predicted MPP superfamily phosphohydrolase
MLSALIAAPLLPVLLMPVLVLVPLLACAGYATLREPYRPVLRRHRLALPAGWPSVSILHISDLHVRRSDLRLLRAQRAALAGLSPDLVCVTGDVCERVADIDLLVDLLRVMRPRYGTFIVLGNHEHNAEAPSGLSQQHASGWRAALGALLDLIAPRAHSAGDAEAHAMADALDRAGFSVLHNAGARLEMGARTLWIAGCDSAWAGHADMLAAMRGRGPSEACLALVHEPELAFEAHAQDADLILAGHTHGGQVRLPLIGAPYTLRNDDRLAIAAGFQRIGQAVLHITAGLGHTIPLRFGVPPEAVWLDCVPVAAEHARHSSAELTLAV